MTQKQDTLPAPKIAILPVWEYFGVSAGSVNQQSAKWQTTNLFTHLLLLQILHGRETERVVKNTALKQTRIVHLWNTYV